MSVKRRIFRQGKSAVITIPAWMLELQGWGVGTVVEVACDPGERIVIFNVDKKGDEVRKREGKDVGGVDTLDQRELFPGKKGGGEGKGEGCFG